MGYYAYLDDDGYYMYAHDGAFTRSVDLNGKGISMAIRKFGTGEVTETDTTHKSAQQQLDDLAHADPAMYEGNPDVSLDSRTEREQQRESQDQ